MYLISGYLERIRGWYFESFSTWSHYVKNKPWYHEPFPFPLRWLAKLQSPLLPLFNHSHFSLEPGWSSKYWTFYDPYLQIPSAPTSLPPFCCRFKAFSCINWPMHWCWHSTHEFKPLDCSLFSYTKDPQRYIMCGHQISSFICLNHLQFVSPIPPQRYPSYHRTEFHIFQDRLEVQILVGTFWPLFYW